MRRYAQRSLRPLIYASLVVLALSLIAPWSWRAATNRPTPVNEQALVEPPLESERVAQSVLKREIIKEQDTAEELTIASEPEINWEPEPQVIAARPEQPIESFEVTPQVAEIVPPVAELIELDPSLAETQEIPPTPPHRAEEPAPEIEPIAPEDLDDPLPPPVERRPSLAPPPVRGVWPFAEALAHQLHALDEVSPESKAWTSRVRKQLETLHAIETLADPQVRTILKELSHLANEVELESAPEQPTRERTLRLRAGYAIVRRLEIWEPVWAIAASGSEQSASNFSAGDLAVALGDIDQLLGPSQAAPAWRAYLRLDELRQLAAIQEEPSASQRALARDVLRRLTSDRLDKTQSQFLSAPAFCRLGEVLHPAAQDPVDWATLLEAIERRELADASVNAQQLSEMYQVLRWSHQPQQAELAEVLNAYYRNANLRLAISEELLNRFIPAPQFMAEPVADNIRGADVFGQSQSLTRLRIVLLPDRLRWRLGLQAYGSVASETESSKGPARFWNDGVGEFHALKQILVDRRGLLVSSAEAKASAESHLKDFETDFDAIPLFGAFARSIARQQYESEQPAARFEIEEKISARARAKLNQEVDNRIAQAEQEFKRKLIDPLDRLNLEPTPVAMETTARRLVVRYRLAGSHQLSAHTPRPQAPGNSLLSLQLHQSVMNNALENLKLDDRRVDLHTLYVEMLKRFEAKNIEIPEDLPEDVTVHFAEHDPVRISNEDGRVCLTIRLKELDHAGKHSWHNFEVRGYYRPSDNQLEANLVRDGTIELVGERLKLGDQIALRGIFARVLSRNRQLSIVNKQLLARPQLADLQVTQFIIQDGWLGIALGPKSDNMRPPPAITTEEEVQEVTRRPLRNLLHGHR